MQYLYVFVLAVALFELTSGLTKKTFDKNEKRILTDLLNEIKQFKEKKAYSSTSQAVKKSENDHVSDEEFIRNLKRSVTIKQDGQDEELKAVKANEMKDQSNKRNEDDSKLITLLKKVLTAKRQEKTRQKKQECSSINPLDEEFDPDDTHVNAFLTRQRIDLLSVCGERADKRTDKDKRIVGGQVSPKGYWPWVVSFVWNGYHMGGGALITKEWVLTAAHLFQKENATALDSVKLCEWNILVGVSDLTNPSMEIRSIAELKVHPEYSVVTYDHDIALVRLDKPIDLNDNKNVICLPSLHFGFSFETSDKGRSDCYVAGWGNLIPQSVFGEEVEIPDKINHVEIPLLSDEDEKKCIKHYAEFERIVPETSFCAGHFSGSKDSCQGDSGGPLVCEEWGYFIQVGVVSHGIGCAWRGFPGIYTNVSAHSTWIIHVLERFTPGGVKELGWEETWNEIGDEIISVLNEFMKYLEKLTKTE